MGKIKKLKSNELVGGVDREDVYPITSTKAVFDDSNTSQDDINKNRLERIEDLEETMPTTVKSITINGGQRINTVDENGNVDLTIYSDGGQDYEGLTEVVAGLRDIVGENSEEPQSGTLLERVDTLEDAVGTGGSVDQRIENAINSLDSQIVVNYGDANPHIRGAVQLVDGKLTRFELEESDIASANALQALDDYTHSIYQTKIEAVSTRPATGEAGIIYRVPNSGGTTYTDWMYSGGWKELATFNIATLNASDVNYDNSQSGLAAENVQGALDELKNAKNLDIINKPGDFMIQDDNNYAIVIFKNGHIFTKNFNSEEVANFGITDNLYEDFSVEDKNGNKVVIFRRGHIKTKYFDSETLTNEIDSKVPIDTYNNDKNKFYKLLPKTLLFNYIFNSAISSDFASNNNWSIVNGRLVSTSAGISNHLVHNKYITIGQKYTYCKFTIHSDTYFGIGWLSSAYAYDGSLFTVNASEGAINIHEAWSSAGTLPAVKYTLPYTFIDGRDYIVKIRKDGHINYLSIIDCLTGAESETIQSVQMATSGLNEFAGGRQMDRMQLVHLSGTSPDIEYVRCCASYKEPLVVVYGDSITEGDRVYNGQTYVDLMKGALGEERVMCSGLSGSQISNLITRMQFELPLLKPKFVMVSIGTNGGNTQALFNQAKQVIESNGAIPIVNVPPMGASGLDTIRSYVLNLGITTARFDIATAINNDVSQGKNTALFADTYHPNSNGHIAMFNRLKSDCNILFNY